MKHDFELIIRKLVAGKFYGDFISLFQWGWIEKKDVREYVRWDDSKRINWKLSAKQNNLYVDVFHQEKDAILQIFFDVNPNRSAGVHELYGNIIIQQYVDLVIYCLRHGIHVECFLPKNNQLIASEVWKDKIKAHGMVSQLEENIAYYQNRSYSSFLEEFVDRMLEEKKRRTILLFSDFLTLTDKMKQSLELLYEDNSLFFFRIPIDTNSGRNYDDWSLKPIKDYWLLMKDIW